MSREHVIPKWVRNALGVQKVMEERQGSTRRLDALSIVLRHVCETCNNGWMSSLEQRVRPALEPMLTWPASGLIIDLDPAQQATLATWAVKTSLLLTVQKFARQSAGWIPSDNLKWLCTHASADRPPPGTRVWLGGIRPEDAGRTRRLSASAQAACRCDAVGRPVAHIGTFTVGHVLLQAYCCERQHSDPSPEADAWLASTGPYRSAMIPIWPSAVMARWPPASVFAVDSLAMIGSRFELDLGLVSQAGSAALGPPQ